MLTHRLLIPGVMDKMRGNYDDPFKSISHKNQNLFVIF